MLLKNKTVKNSLYSALYQVLILFVPLATTPYITRIFTAEQLGVYASSLALVSFFVVLASFGLPLYGSREIAKSSGNNRQLRFVQFFLFQIVTSIISFILFIILIRVTGANKYYYYQSLLIIVNIFDVSWFFIGIEEIERTLLRNFFSKIFTLITIFIFVKTSSDLNIYIFLNILGMFIGNISMIIQLKKFLFQPFNLVFLDYKSIKECFNLFIPQILSNSKNTFDRLILLTLTGNNSFVGLYDQGRKLINIIIAVSNSATTAVLPKMTSLKAQNETKKFEMIIHKVLPILVLFSVFATTGLIINADLFVSIFFGSSFTDVSQVLKYLSLSLLVIPLNFFLYNAILLPSSEDKIYRNILTINFFVVILLNLALDRKLDINGAIISFVVSEYVSLIYCIFKLKISRLKKQILKYLVFSISDCIISICFFYLVTEKLNLIFTGFTGLLIQIIYTSVIFIILHLLYFLIFITIKKLRK